MRVAQVLKDRNLVEKSQRARRKEELGSLRATAAFKASLHDEMRRIDILLDSGEVEEVMIEVPENLLAKFGDAIYSDEMLEYDITQLPDEPRKFSIRYKTL